MPGIKGRQLKLFCRSLAHKELFRGEEFNANVEREEAIRAGEILFCFGVQVPRGRPARCIAAVERLGHVDLEAAVAGLRQPLPYASPGLPEESAFCC